MTTEQLPPSPPLAIDVDLTEDIVTVKLTLAPYPCTSKTGKMMVLATTNGWIKTDFICPRTGEQIQVNLFLGTRK